MLHILYIAVPSVSLQRSNFVVFENESVVAILLTRTGDTGVPATVFVSTAEISDGGNALSKQQFYVLVRETMFTIDFRWRRLCGCFTNSCGVWSQ